MDKPIVLHVGKQEVQVIPSAMHEYVMTTEQVALGYGVTQENVRQHKATKREELQEGKHWMKLTNPRGGAPITMWTKRGVIRLGFFMHSERARCFRDLAEELVISGLEQLPEFAQRLEHMLTEPHTAKQQVGWVYFITAEGEGLVKIGYTTKNPAARLTGLQVGSSTKLELLGCFRGTLKDEKEMHARFDLYRKHGEWFFLTPPIQHAIYELTEKEAVA